MGLPELPNDVWLEITRRLNVHDILHVRQVSKRLQFVTRLRAVWQTVLSQACIQYGVPRFASQVLHCNDHELEYIACRPSRFQAILTTLACDAEDPGRFSTTKHEGSDVSMKSNRSALPTPSLFRPIHEYTLPDDNYTNVYLVNGGKWLLTVSADTVLRVWDLEPFKPPSKDRHDSAPRPGSSRPPRFTGARPELYGQGNIESPATFMDAHLSNDRNELYVFLRTTSSDDNDPKVTAICVKFDLLLGPPPDDRPHPCHHVSAWTREAVSLDASWIKAFGTDIAVFTRRTTRRTAWIWDWRRNLTKKLTNFQVPSGADSLLCMKIVSRHLVAVHGDGPRKCTVSLYELPSLASDPLARPSVEFERKPILHSAELVPETMTEPAETQLALFTSKFHGIHHVEAFRPKVPSSASGRAASSHFQGLSRVTFVDRRSAMHSVPFNIGTVSLSEPFWIVPPQRSTEEADRPQGLQELGSFRIAIGVESVGDAAWRSRLQYYMRVDLNAIGERTNPCLPANDSSQVSVVSGDATIAPPGTIPYPRLRGRVSASRESAAYFHDRLFIASGKLTLLSVWSASDGIHAHTSNVLKPEDRNPKVKSVTKEKRLFPAAVSVRVRQGQSTSSSRPSIPTVPEAPQFKSLAPESYSEMGAEVIAYAWNTPEKVRPKPTMEEIIEDAMSECSSGSAESLSRKLRRVYEPSRRDLLGNRLSMKVDLFSGRMVVLDEIEGDEGEEERRMMVVRVMEYV